MSAGGSAASIAPAPGRTFARLWPLALGLLALAGLWLGPLPAMARTAFSPHMILHLALVAIAAPLIAAGIARAGILAAGTGRTSGAFLLAAVAASLMEASIVWGWHAPALHEAAARHGPAFVAQQASFLAAGLALWLTAFAARTRAEAAIGALAMLTSFVHMTMLGVLLATAPDLLYAPDVCRGAFGFDRLGDQRFGGVLMAVFGALPFLAGGLFLLARVLAPEEA